MNGRSVNGQWSAANLYYLDGVINTSVLNTAAAVVPILDAIQEFKVQSHNDKAEYGGVLGGIVNVVSKSGTNQAAFRLAAVHQRALDSEPVSSPGAIDFRCHQDAVLNAISARSANHLPPVRNQANVRNKTYPRSGRSFCWPIFASDFACT